MICWVFWIIVGVWVYGMNEMNNTAGSEGVKCLVSYCWKFCLPWGFVLGFICSVSSLPLWLAFVCIVPS